MIIFLLRSFPGQLGLAVRRKLVAVCWAAAAHASHREDAPPTVERLYPLVAVRAAPLCVCVKAPGTFFFHQGVRPDFRNLSLK